MSAFPLSTSNNISSVKPAANQTTDLSNISAALCFSEAGAAGVSRQLTSNPQHQLPSQNNSNPTPTPDMSAPNEGRQSPAPEESSGKQQQSAPSSGQGVNPETNNKEESKKQLDVLIKTQLRTYQSANPVYSLSRPTPPVPLTST
ncbi:hypothetical protein MBM_06053 [Drepanopeziza brunnea f. sp. 'multigermtubi' MB_m1]|uniref:Uncharacterized protein n=1 Tax=Marssonina brunnea f. sp. multigermtubi (strain MB_m1) TaxID=1072389 RepID=K1WUB3_MARBU|nr:uncharacterized protein MBM_06053 [Drepanopeziza brunnea f. sp. 'multigermtubi' MB_m1]EKD16042.1 hypothetical protein MBM_06053 [Drepanopeziza brunnea f. sp. 'multigermtubi' MB_m1]